MSANYWNYMYDAQGTMVKSINGDVEDKSGLADDNTYVSYNLNDDRAMSTPAPLVSVPVATGMRMMTSNSLPGVEGFRTREDDEEDDPSVVQKSGGTSKLVNCGHCTYTPDFMNGYMQCHDCKFKVNGNFVDNLFANGAHMKECVQKNSDIYLKNAGSDDSIQLRLACD